MLGNTVNICASTKDAMLIVETAGLQSALPLLFVFGVDCEGFI